MANSKNQLLKAVSADLAVPEHLAGCKALGIINKVITGPLWRVLEDKDITILDMNECLFAPSDNIVEEILTMLFGAFSSLLTCLVGEHLPDGKYDVTNVSLIAETKSVPKTNTISERDFFSEIDFIIGSFDLVLQQQNCQLVE